MIVVIADDLSGASELAAIAADAGLRAEVVTVGNTEDGKWEMADGPELLVVDGDTRGMGEREAAERMREIGGGVRGLQVEWVFKKVDSVLRGHVRVEADALKERLGLSEVLLVSANPSKGRVVTKGQYWVAGVPLEQTVFATDPDFPRRSGVVRELVGEPGPDWQVPDVGSAEALDEIAVTWDRERQLAVGAADFFRALLRKPVRTFVKEVPTAGARLFLCGSAAGWPERKKQAEAAGIAVRVLGDGLAPAEVMLLGLGETIRAGRSLGWCAALAREGADWVRERSGGELFLEGGATAKALADVCGWDRFTVEPGAPVGVAILRPVPAPEWRCWVKPGSYPWPPGWVT